MDINIPLHVIGLVRTGHDDLENVPIQAGINRAEQGVIEIDQAYRDGLDGLSGFDYAWLITWLHGPAGAAGAPDVPDTPALRQVPFLLRGEGRGRELGIFATRGPRRVNSIGLSLIKLLDVTGTAIRFAGVDLLDGTAVIDLKPYVSRFDRPDGEPRCGWFDQVDIADGTTPAQLAAKRGMHQPPAI